MVMNFTRSSVVCVVYLTCFILVFIETKLFQQNFNKFFYCHQYSHLGSIKFLKQFITYKKNAIIFFSYRDGLHKGIINKSLILLLKDDT